MAAPIYLKTWSRAELRAKRLMRESKKDVQRLAAADRILQKGDISAAAHIFSRLAKSVSNQSVKQQAQERLSELREEARSKLSEADSAAGGHNTVSSTADVLLAARGDEKGLAWRNDVEEVFSQYSQVLQTYGNVPVVGDEITAQVRRQRHLIKFAAVLNEQMATELVSIAENYEDDDKQCCAFFVYEQASALLPAPSARLARDRFAEMVNDPQLTHAAEMCRNLRWCHNTYQRAERLAQAKPERAKEMFSQIVERAPQDSLIYHEARKLFHEL